MKTCGFYFSFCVVLLIKAVCSTSPGGSQKQEIVLPPCKACTVLFDSLHSAKENAPGNADDETALQYILDNVCDDVTRGQTQCYALRDMIASGIKEHWRLEAPHLFEILCINELKACCPEDHYGPKCDKCQDCRNNGKCKGAGTRKGNGKCLCNPGYTGYQCRECAVSYYEAFRDESKLLCSKCHDACGKEGCTSSGPKGCLTCNPGWRMDSSTGCSDVNECWESGTICTDQHFCVNNDGSYSCLECDRSCIGCEGDGPDMCKKCVDGFDLIEGKCTDVSQEQREQYVTTTRLLTYFGFCLATVAIFQSSANKAYMVGAAVATYIALSEYWLNTTPAPADIKSQLDSKKLQDLITSLL